MLQSSCVTNFLDLYHYVFGECDRSRAVGVVFLDFRRPLIKSLTKRIIRRGRSVGIQDNVAAWIENWLAGRRQRVIVNGVHSNRTVVHSGDDLDLSLSSKVSKFADDTKLGIYSADPKSMRALWRDLAVIWEWYMVEQMPFKLDKCHVLLVGAATKWRTILCLLRKYPTLPKRGTLVWSSRRTSRALRNV